MEHTESSTVPRDLVQAVLIALIHPRPILVSTSSYADQVTLQTMVVVESLLGHFDRSKNVVMCHKELTWSALSRKLSADEPSALILRNVDRLDLNTQLHFGYALMQPDEGLQQFTANSALIFTTKASTDTLHPFLRRQILLRANIALEEDLPVVNVPPPSMATKNGVLSMLDQIRSAIPRVTIVPELLRYLMDIVIFLRSHRFAEMGLRPQAATDFEVITRTLCVIMGQSFATPVIIKRAAKLALVVHARIRSAEDEPSLQYGGDLALAQEWIRSWDSEALIDSVLEQVPVPK